MKQLLKYLTIFSLSILFIIGCEYKITPPSEGGSTSNDTSYVEISPPWGGFGSPRAILIGNDQLIYVADYDSNQIVMMDAAGTIIGHHPILHPISIAQNSKLDLYVGGEAVVHNGSDTIGAIYRISLVRWDTTYIAGFTIDTLSNDTTYIIRDTSYFYNHDLYNAHTRIVYQEPGRPDRRFPGIGLLPGNGYLVARVGPDNTSAIDPDCRIILFDTSDVSITPIAGLFPYSQGGTIDQLTGLMTFPSSNDFIFAQKSNTGGVGYGAVWMIYKKDVDFEGWLTKFDPLIDFQRGVDFVRSYLFREARGIAYDKKRREIFIVDSELDSVVKFNRNGQFRTESFGRSKAGLIKPYGAAFSNDCTLYITDLGNRTNPPLIRRFRLSTQLQCN
jgi:hypothetical protein